MGKTFKAILSFAVGVAMIVGGIITMNPMLIIGGVAQIASGIMALAAMGARQSGVELNQASTTAPLPVVYGKAKLGIRPVDTRVYGPSEDRKELWVVGALCMGSEDGNGIEAIDEIYFDQKLAFNAAGTVDAAYTGVASVAKKYGTDTQVVHASLNTRFPTEWNSTAAGRGIAYLVFQLIYDQDKYPSGVPNITALVRGQKVYDTRVGGAFAWSDNPALAIYDLLRSDRYGLAAAATEIDTESFSTLANYCDELVTVPGDPSLNKTITGATSASPIVITSAGHGLSTSDQVVVQLKRGVSGSGMNGLVPAEGYRTYTVTFLSSSTFSLQGSTGTGAYTASSCEFSKLLTQKRFTVNGWIDAGSPVDENIRQLLSSCRGALVYEGGKFRVFARKVQSPTTFALTEANIVGNWQFATPGIRETANLASAAFINPAREYQPDPVYWPREGETNTYLATDAGFEVRAEMELPFTNERYMAEQIAMVALRESRAALTVGVVATEAALVLQIGDVVPVTHSTPGWTAKPFWVMGLTLNMDATVALALMEYDANAYVLDPHKQFPALDATDHPDPSVCPPPTALVLTSDSTTAVIAGDGTVTKRVLIQWTKAVDPFRDYYEIRYKLVANSVYVDGGAPLRDDEEAYLQGAVEDGVNYNVEIRCVNTLGVKSTWLAGTITPTAVDNPAGGVGKNLVMNGGAELDPYINWKIAAKTGGLTRTNAESKAPEGLWCWEVTGNTKQLVTDQYITVDTDAGAYQMSLWARQQAFGTGMQYAGFQSYDKDKVSIAAAEVYAPNGIVTVTTLAADLNGGDTSILLTDASTFIADANSYCAVNCADDGSDLPNREVFKYTGKSTNTLTGATVSGSGLIAASGTKVRFHRSAGSYNYNLLNNVAVGAMPSEWTKYSDIVEGVDQGGTLDVSKFRVGTAYIKPLLLVNWAGTGSNDFLFDEFTIIRLDEALWRGGYGGTVDAATLAAHMGLLATNMIQNGGGQEGVVEVQAPDWTTIQGYGMVPSTGNIKTGDRSLKCAALGTADVSQNQQIINVTDGIYLFSGWLKSVAPSNVANEYAGIIFHGVTGAAVSRIIESITLGAATAGPTWAAATLPWDGVSRDWTYVEGVAEITGTGTAALDVWMGGWVGNVTGTLYADALRVVRLTAGVYSLYDSNGKLRDEVLQVGTDGTARTLVKGKLRGVTHHNAPVTFSPPFSDAPAVRFAGGLVNEPRAVWGSIAAIDGLPVNTATTATPIAVHTVASHGLSTSDRVNIYKNGATDPVLNLVGSWVVTVTGTKDFTLDGSVGVGTYVANSANVSTGRTALNTAIPQKDYSFPVNLSGTGFTTRALLQQRPAPSLTARSVNGTGINACTVANDTDSVDLGASNVPAYDDKYTVTVLGYIQAIGKFATGRATHTMRLESNDGGGWVPRLTFTHVLDFDVQPGLNTDTDSFENIITVSGLVPNDDIRVVYVSLSADTPALNLSATCGIRTTTGITWFTSSANETYASKTPEGDDDIAWEADGYL